MLNLALIPKQQEFGSPSSLTHQITSHSQTIFVLVKEAHRKRENVPQYCFIKSIYSVFWLHNVVGFWTLELWHMRAARGQNKNRWATSERLTLLYWSLTTRLWIRCSDLKSCWQLVYPMPSPIPEPNATGHVRRLKKRAENTNPRPRPITAKQRNTFKSTTITVTIRTILDRVIVK